MVRKLGERELARRLRSKGLSIKEIARKILVAKSSVSVWVRNIKLTDSQRAVLKKRELEGSIKGRKTLARKWQEYHLNHPKPVKIPKPQRFVETFFDVWTPNMAYVLGYFAADGCMYKNKNGSCYLGFLSIDEELIITVRKIMKVTNRIEIRQRKSWKSAYILQIGSKILYNKLLNLGLTPTKA